MRRGYLDFLKQHQLYSGSKKKWTIDLCQSNCFWYDLVATEHPLVKPELIKSRLKEIRDHVTNQIDKRFIYYIATRKRVRFSEALHPKLEGNIVSIWIEIGKDRHLQRLNLILPEGSCTSVIADPRMISFVGPNGRKISQEIHGFLETLEANFGIESEVKYVGMTKDPTRRPLFDGHIPLGKISYDLDREEEDIFVYFNTFRVMTSAISDRLNSELRIPNAATDEVSVENEGRIIEKALIYYFMPKYNNRNGPREIGELKNKLIELARFNQFKKVELSLEILSASEYFHFSSPTVPSSPNHSFECEIMGKEIKLNKIKSLV